MNYVCSEYTLREILLRLKDEADKIYGNTLKELILYGSYARGDNDDESDIDVMIILDIPVETELEYSRLITDAIVDLNLEFDVVISSLIESKEKYDKFKNINPLFMNIEKEGIKIAA